MILLDFSNIAISSITSDRDFIRHMNIDLIRHIVLNSIKTYNKKFRRDYGEMIICCDSKTNWRKKIYPLYKENRKDKKRDSDIDWNLVYKFLEQVKSELIEHFPYKVLQIDEMEADDIISSLVRWSQYNYIDEESLTEEPKMIMIVSGDEDFLQLQYYENVEQFSHKTKSPIICRHPEKFLFEKICRGDSGDGVTNILSPENSLVDKIRQKQIRSTMLEEWEENGIPKELQKRFNTNKTLVSLIDDVLPKELYDECINKFENYQTNSKKNLMKYFMNNGLVELMEDLQDF